jgi:hypothetical protein
LYRHARFPQAGMQMPQALAHLAVQKPSGQPDRTAFRIDEALKAGTGTRAGPCGVEISRVSVSAAEGRQGAA